MLQYATASSQAVACGRQGKPRMNKRIRHHRERWHRSCFVAPGKPAAEEGDSMRRWLKTLELMFEAIAFAEAGEFETARQIMRKDSELQ